MKWLEGAGERAVNGCVRVRTSEPRLRLPSTRQRSKAAGERALLHPVGELDPDDRAADEQVRNEHEPRDEGERDADHAVTIGFGLEEARHVQLANTIPRVLLGSCRRSCRARNRSADPELIRFG